MKTTSFKCTCGNIAYYTRRYGWRCKCNNPERYDAAKALKNGMAELLNEQRELEELRTGENETGMI